ncbi:MAG TPA: MarR family transcriptional regulator [Opitutales bacterium]|jgi:DNA-binding MarR family transcriptional regulator|nr:MarR family transcriptional regulator [Opitutales bacterium]
MTALAHRTPSQAAFGGVLRSFGLIHRVMRPYFHQFGLSQAQWAILRTLHRAATEEGRTEGLRMMEIGQRLLVQPPSVTTLVHRLVKARLVRQVKASTDRRGFMLRLTPKGEKLVNRVLLAHHNQIRLVMGGLADDELPRLHGYLERLNTHLAALAAKIPATLD